MTLVLNLRKIAILLLAVVIGMSSISCGSDPEGYDDAHNEFITPAKREERERRRLIKQERKENEKGAKNAQDELGNAPTGTALYEEPPEGTPVEIAGKWRWPSLTTDFTEERRMNPVTTQVEGESGWTFTIVKKGSGYATTNTISSVTLDGRRVTVMEEASDGDTISFTGDVQGDTIVGTVRYVVVAKTGSSGVPTGESVYEGPWTATRVK